MYVYVEEEHLAGCIYMYIPVNLSKLLCGEILRSIQVKYSFSVEEYFKACKDSSNCPDNSECELIPGVGCSTNKCKCNDGFDAVDLPFQSDGQTVTVCADLGFCSPFDNFENDCGVNGQCTVIVDEYGRIRAACECYIGYYGPSCEETSPETSPSTKMPVITTTKKPGNIGAILPILGSGVLFLALIAGGAAALASTAG